MNYNHFEYPSEEEKKSILSNNKILIELSFDLDLKEKHHICDPNLPSDLKYNTELKEWLRQFNANKLNQLRITYINLMNFYNKISERKNYDNWEENYYHCKFMFEYYVNVFYYIFCSIIDHICQIINVYYKLEINEDDNSLGKKVVDELENINKKLAKFLKNKYKSPEMNKAKSIRNNLTHNYPPNRSRRYIKVEEDKSENYTQVRGFYKKVIPKGSIIDNICDLIEMLYSILKRLEKDFNNKCYDAPN